MNRKKSDLYKEVVKTFEIFFSDDTYVEVRLLGTSKGTISGYFNDLEALIKAVEPYDGKYNIFMTMNKINPDLSARAKNKLKQWAKETATDKDILCRKWILIDLDPVRPSGISSTDEELEQAEELMEKIRTFLQEHGFTEPMVACSGNGYHLLYPIDMPNDSDAAEKIREFLQALDRMFSNDKVKVDTANFNAGRITKLYGTIACKGDDTEDRPHRRSHIITAPESIEPVEFQYIQAVINEAPKDKKSGGKINTSQKKKETWKRISVKEYLTDNGLEIAREKEYMGGICYVLKKCPFNSDHTDTGAYVIEYPNGKICAGCHHDSCTDKGWKDLLKLYPDKRMMPPKRKGSDTDEENAVDTILKDIEEEQHIFYHDRSETPYVSVINDGIRQYMEVYGNDYKKYIRYMFYDRYQKAVPKDALQRVLDTLAVKAQIEGKEITVAYRCAYHEGKIFYYLADREQTVICIDEEGYSVIAESPVPFIKKQNMSEQVLPQESDISLRKLGMRYWKFATKEDRILHWVLLATRFISEGSQPLIYYFGDRGSAKSTSMKMDKMIVDPSEIDIKALPKNIADVIASVTNQYMVCFDNVSQISDELSNIFCIVATHGYYSKRKLYSNNEECAVKLNARVSFSGITNLSTKPDLIDRLVCLKLNRIDSSDRRTEDEIMGSFKIDLPYILDGIFRTLSRAIPIYENLNLKHLPRMADFAKWGYAIAEALGYGGDRFMKIYEKNQNELLENMVSEDAVITVLIEMLKKRHYFKGKVTDLLSILTTMAEDMNLDIRVGWARDASTLSRRLYESQSVLSMFGVSIHRGKANGDRYIELTMEAGDSSHQED